MPRATRKRAAAPVAEAEAGDQQPAEGADQQPEQTHDGDGGGDGHHADAGGAEQRAHGRLENGQPITWRAGKPIPVGTLLPRLKALVEELQSIEQGDVASEVLQPKAAELVSTQLLDHKDHGVRVYALLCIVELFRIMAPNAPFKQSQLVKIFDIIVRSVVPALADPSHSYNGEHSAIVASLANVKSILLLCDLPGSETRLRELFTHCFDVMAGNSRSDGKELLSRNVEFAFTAMLCALVDECPTLPAEVTDVILAQFLRADPHVTTTKKGEPALSEVLKEVSPAYNMAVSICNTCEETMIRQVGSYFNSVLIDASSVSGAVKANKPKGKKRIHNESEDEDDASLLVQPSDEDLQEVAKAHRLLRELWRACPAVIQNVIPQMEAEMNVENVSLRVMAVQSVGDMISGIGAAGPPPAIPLVPDAYPAQSLDSFATPSPSNILLIPAAPQAFSTAYPSAYQTFYDRHRDKAAHVRAAWVTEAARVVLTSGGGKGLDNDQETKLLRCFADMLADHDEKVRSAAVQALAQFDFHSIVNKLGRIGGVKKEGSLLANFATTCLVDQKQTVSIAATELAGRIWGVASGAIIEGDEKVRDLLGAIPSEILRGKYKNKPYLNQLIDQVVAESLLPLGFPPIKSRKDSKNDCQRVADSQGTPDRAPAPVPDKIRVARILALVRDLDGEGDRHPKAVFLSALQRQVQLAKYVKAAVDASERIGANPKSKDARADKQTLEKFVKVLASSFAEPETAGKELTRFFQHYDRRNYVLVRFCVEPSSEYKKVNNAIRELRTRMSHAPSSIVECTRTLTHLLSISSYLVYNRSHVPAIVEFSRTDEAGLGHTAHEVLKDISTKAPSIFEVHVRELCETLKEQAPSPTSANRPSAADTLKACAGFARQFPQKMPTDRSFYQAMSQFAKLGSSPTVVKHAITVIVASASEREIYVQDILQHSLRHFDVNGEGYLAKLAAISQLSLLAHKQLEDQKTAIETVLTAALKNRAPAQDTDPDWQEEMDDDLTAKLLALKAITNRARGKASDTEDEEASTGQVARAAQEVLRVLNTAVKEEGELAGQGPPTPAHYRSRTRLAAAKLILKLCCHKAVDATLGPVDFVSLTKVVQDPVAEVRKSFNTTLRKYLGQGKLNHRFYALMFLYAFEPVKSTKEATATFLRARATYFARNQSPVMESVFAHFLSLLAHHQDFTQDAKDLEDFIEYIVFFLRLVSTDQNLGTLYAITRRLKQVEDGIDANTSASIWTIADLSEGTIRIYEQVQGWTLQAPPTRVNLPRGIFQPIVHRELAAEVAEKRFLPPELDDELEDLVKKRLRYKKRKVGDEDGKRAAKRSRTSAADGKSLPARRAPKERKKATAAKTPRPSRVGEGVPESERRKSSRVRAAKSYLENSDSEDVEVEEDEEDEEGEEDEEAERRDADDSSDADEDADRENTSSTPPTSDPLHSQPIPNGTNQVTAKPTPKTAPTPAAKKRTAQPKAPAQKKAATASAAPKKELPARAGRTRGNGREEKNIMDIPSDSDEELSDAPEGMEL